MPDIPSHPEDIRDLIMDSYYQEALKECLDDGDREHLGASLIGKPCMRELWYSFRWAMITVAEGRMQRLFGIGNMMEDRLADDLRRIGCNVVQYDDRPNSPTYGKQYRLTAHGGHFGCSPDGIVKEVPQGGKAWHILEFKTHNDKSFKKLQKEGVVKSKFQHYCQMQCEMGLTGLQRALYSAENKDDSDLYYERVYYDENMFKALLDKAYSIIFGIGMPEKMSEDPESQDCKYCDYRMVCHFNKPALKNCRTCQHSKPVENGTWQCGFHHITLDKAMQMAGCEDYEVRKGLETK